MGSARLRVSGAVNLLVSARPQKGIPCPRCFAASQLTSSPRPPEAPRDVRVRPPQGLHAQQEGARRRRRSGRAPGGAEPAAATGKALTKEEAKDRKRERAEAAAACAPATSVPAGPRPGPGAGAGPQHRRLPPHRRHLVLRRRADRADRLQRRRCRTASSTVANLLWGVLALAVVVDSVLISRKIKRLVNERFPKTKQRMGSLYLYGDHARAHLPPHARAQARGQARREDLEAAALDRFSVARAPVALGCGVRAAGVSRGPLHTESADRGPLLSRRRPGGAGRRSQRRRPPPRRTAPGARPAGRPPRRRPGGRCRRSRRRR